MTLIYIYYRILFYFSFALVTNTALNTYIQMATQYRLKKPYTILSKSEKQQTLHLYYLKYCNVAEIPKYIKIVVFDIKSLNSWFGEVTKNTCVPNYPTDRKNPIVFLFGLYRDRNLYALGYKQYGVTNDICKYHSHLSSTYTPIDDYEEEEIIVVKTPHKRKHKKKKKKKKREGGHTIETNALTLWDITKTATDYSHNQYTTKTYDEIKALMKHTYETGLKDQSRQEFEVGVQFTHWVINNTAKRNKEFINGLILRETDKIHTFIRYWDAVYKTEKDICRMLKIKTRTATNGDKYMRISILDYPLLVKEYINDYQKKELSSKNVLTDESITDIYIENGHLYLHGQSKEILSLIGDCISHSFLKKYYIGCGINISRSERALLTELQDMLLPYLKIGDTKIYSKYENNRGGDNNGKDSNIQPVDIEDLYKGYANTPPCIQGIVDTLNPKTDSKNKYTVKYNGRVAIITYMIKMHNMKRAKLRKLFKYSNNKRGGNTAKGIYSEIDHYYTSETQYNIPSCSKMQDNGYCPFTNTMKTKDLGDKTLLDGSGLTDMRYRKFLTTNLQKSGESTIGSVTARMNCYIAATGGAYNKNNKYMPMINNPGNAYKIKARLQSKSIKNKFSLFPVTKKTNN